MFDIFKDLGQLRPIIARQDRWKFLLLFGLMFTGSILEAIGIGAIPAFVTMVMKPSALAENRWVGEWFVGLPDQITIELLLWASGGLFAFIVLKNLFLTFVFYIQTRIVTIQRVKLSDRMFKIYQAAPYEWHLQRSSSDLLRSIQTDTAQVLSGVVMPFLDLLMAMIMTVVIVSVMVMSTPGVTLLALLVTGFGLFLVIRTFQKKLRSFGLVFRRETKELIKAIQQGFGSLVDSRILGCESYLNKAHRDSLVRWSKAAIHQTTIQKATPYAMEVFSVLGLLIILLLLVKGVQSGESLGQILPIIALLGVVMVRLKQLASQIAGSINTMNAARVYIPAIVEDLNELSAIEDKRKKLTSEVRLINDFQTLKLDNVNYAYPNTVTPAIRNISLELKRGESIAFVGATGCGKSTLVSLILGLLDVQEGSIKVNDIDIVRDLDGWRAQLGYIPQSVYLIDDTIRGNVAFGMSESEVDESQLWRALDTACLSSFVKTLPEGVDTVIGEGGVRLSGGQRQRLGIARAIYPDPEVLVMDEATSALDNKTEEVVMQAIQNLKQNRTLIMIAHRLSTVEECDRLYFLSEGKIESVGSIEELMQNSVSFQEMAVNIQS